MASLAFDEAMTRYEEALEVAASYWLDAWSIKL
jgi:hypothetical protein